jgi:hypothetical protein
MRRILTAPLLAAALLCTLGAVAKDQTPAEGFMAEVTRAIGEFSAGLEKGDAADVAWVKTKLTAMAAADQHIRGARSTAAYGSLSAPDRAEVDLAVARATLKLDKAHTKELKKMLKEHGWMKIRTFGPQADYDAWMIVQHASYDPKFQADVLETLGDLVSVGETAPVNYAYLSDRLATADGRGQLFGTQGRCTAPASWEPMKIQDPANVDARREAYGMSSMEDYLVETSAMCP